LLIKSPGAPALVLSFREAADRSAQGGRRGGKTEAKSGNIASLLRKQQIFQPWYAEKGAGKGSARRGNELAAEAASKLEGENQ